MACSAASPPIHAAEGRQTSVTRCPRRASSRLKSRQWRIAPLIGMPDTISITFMAGLLAAGRSQKTEVRSQKSE